MVPKVSSERRLSDHLGTVLVRLGIRRDSYRIAPGLYALGEANESSPVLVTCNFKLTFDTLRKAMAGRACWILVVETYGINVWCAAGKQSFSTEEVAQRVRKCGLDKVVSHRTLILPQLAGPSVAAHTLQRLCGFSGVFGPVCSCDLPAFLDADMEADTAMRTVRFPLGQRLTVALVEVYGARKLLLWLLAACFLLAVLGPAWEAPWGVFRAGLGAYATVLCGFVTGVFLVPALLFRLPFRAFAAKGFVAGAGIGIGLTWLMASTPSQALAQVLACSVLASWFAMHYTGSTPFTSLSGVDREMRFFIPVQGGLLGCAILIWLIGSWF